MSKGENGGPCAQCNALCCRNYSVCLTAHDLQRLFKKTGRLDWAAAAKAESVKNPPFHSFFLFEKGIFKEYFLCLARDASEACVFLGEKNKCVVYSSRPTVCRMYPFELDSTGSLKYKKNHRCPVLWKLGGQEVERFLADARQRQRELDDYGVWCREWNALHARKKGLKSFLKFLLGKAKEEGEH